MNRTTVKKAITLNFKNALNSKANLTDKLTDEIIERKAMSKVWTNPERQHVTSNIIPGVNLGYGGDRQDANIGDGIGPSRLINSSNYALRSTFTFEGVKLTTGILKGLSTEFSAFLDYVSSDLSEDKKTVKFDEVKSEINEGNSAKNKGYVTIASGFIDVSSKGTHIEIMVSNVKKNFINYQGDVSIHLVRKFDVLSDFFCNASLSVKRRELYNSMKTSDLYSPRDSEAGEISNNFIWVIKRSMNVFSDKVEKYKSIIENVSGKKYKPKVHNIITMYNV
jgi:hypothetical protein